MPLAKGRRTILPCCHCPTRNSSACSRPSLSSSRATTTSSVTVSTSFICESDTPAPYDDRPPSQPAECNRSTSSGLSSRQAGSPTGNTSKPNRHRLLSMSLGSLMKRLLCAHFSCQPASSPTGVRTGMIQLLRSGFHRTPCSSTASRLMERAASSSSGTSAYIARRVSGTIVWDTSTMRSARSAHVASSLARARLLPYCRSHRAARNTSCGKSWSITRLRNVPL